MRSRLSYEDVKKNIQSCGYTLLSQEYQDANSKIEIKCNKGHKYQVTYGNFQQGHRCPQCYYERCGNNRRLNYNIVKQEIEKVGYKLLSKSYQAVRSKLEIECDNGHIYKVTYTNFQQGHRCPRCVHDIIRLDYIFVKNAIKKVGYTLLSDSYQNSGIKLKIECNKGHIYEACYDKFKYGRRCPICANNYLYSYEFVKQKIELGGYTLLSHSYDGCKKKMSIQCNNGHVYYGTFDKFQRGQRCPKCFGGSSKMEKEIQNWLSDYVEIKCNERFYYDGHKFYETDIYVPSKKIAIEFDGIYYHSELLGKDKNYHLRKTDFFKEQDIQLIHVFENEWILKQDIVKSVIMSKLGLSSDRIYARKCQIRNLTSAEAKHFLGENHLQGYIGSSVRIGLIYNDKIVSIMTFGKPRFNKKYEWEMIRFCNKLDTSVLGGFGRLLNFFIKEHSNSIVSYADRRYSDGGVYLNNHFRLSHSSKPNYFYFKNGNYELESRNKYQKHKLCKLLNSFNSSLTEWENMQLNGYNRIFDCGNLVFVYDR